MSLEAADLEAFVEEAGSRAADVDSPRALELRIVEPLLETLGWDVRSPEVEPDAAVGDLRMDYCLTVDDVPAVLVVTTSPTDAIPEDRVAAVAATIHSNGPDWAIVTNGSRFVLLAETHEGVHRETVALEDLADAVENFTHYARQATVRREKNRRDDIAAAAERLAARRDEAIDAVTAAIVEIAGPPIEAAARDRARALVDDLAVDPGPGGRSTIPDDESRESSKSSKCSEHSATDSETRSTATSTDPDRQSSADTGEPDASDDSSVPPPAVREAGTGTYVARFFGGGSSVGAIGGETPTGTLVGVVEYLLENQSLASSITLPWSVDDERARIARTPEHPDGTSMDHFETVDGTLYVWTGGDVDRVRATVSELADATGLRVMFQGDW